MSEMQIASFKVDVTPPVGAQMAYDINKQVDTPIYIRGLILDDSHTRAVVVSCGNGMYAYIPKAEMYEEGGYEPKASTCTPEIEQRLKGGIAEVLQSLR